MINKYSISSTGPQKTTAALNDTNIVILTQPTDAELHQVCQAFDLNKFTFQYHSSPEEVSRFTQISSEALTTPFLLVIYDFIAELDHVENQLAPTIIIWDVDHLIICTDNIKVSSKIAESKYTDLTTILFYHILQCQHKIMATLLNYKKQIDDLDQAARQGFNNKRLRELTTLTRKLVFFEHTMNDQAMTIKTFVKSDFCQKVTDGYPRELVVQQLRLTKAIHIFRDLLESISSLFTAMMDSNLNSLMKFLDSAGLVIATAALVSGFMGMNVGGLPWKNDLYGFWLILAITLVLSLTITLVLRKKRYLK